MEKYHYTIEHKAALILASGELQPTGQPSTPREKPVLWFSTNCRYEPTAIKPIIVNGKIQHLTFEQYAEMFKLYRFTLVSNRYLSPWLTTNKLAKTPSKLRKGMEIAARNLGQSVAQYYGTLEPVPVGETLLEVWEAGAWRLAGAGDQPQLQEGAVFQNYSAALGGLL